MTVKSKYNIAIIPARGGSKGVPGKNIKPLNNIPLIEYSIKGAVKANVFDKIIISTDTEIIRDICVSCCDEIEVIMRPASLATDKSRTEDALLHVCDVLEEKEGFIPEFVFTLEPTSPFRDYKSIRKAAEILKNGTHDSIVSVSPFTDVLGRISKEQFIHIFPNQPRRRQEREVLYKESSTIYGTQLSVLRQKVSVLGNNPYPLIISEEEAFDINEQLDFEVAEALMRYRSNGNA